ncbi:MAG: hypothetical protein H6573_15435 [Lewinellaceae bacterium]|nr:hypothetical protein [Lewinellaceae bacterium]
MDSFDIEPRQVISIHSLPSGHHCRNALSGISFELLGVAKPAVDPFYLKNHPPEEIAALFQIHKDYTCFATPGAIVIQDQVLETSC